MPDPDILSEDDEPDEIVTTSPGQLDDLPPFLRTSIFDHMQEGKLGGLTLSIDRLTVHQYPSRVPDGYVAPAVLDQGDQVTIGPTVPKQLLEEWGITHQTVLEVLIPDEDDDHGTIVQLVGQASGKTFERAEIPPEPKTSRKIVVCGRGQKGGVLFVLSEHNLLPVNRPPRVVKT